MAILSNAAAQAALTAILTELNGPGNAYLRFYTGTPPADADAATTGTLLVTFDLNSADGFGAVGDLAPGAYCDTTAVVPLTVAAAATGTATYFRIFDNAGLGACAIQGTLGEGTGDIQLNSVNLQVGVNVTLNSLRLVVPEQ